MNIVYCAIRFPKLSESFVLNEIVELTKRGHNVAVFARTDPQEDVVHEELDGLDIPVHYAGVPEPTSRCARNVIRTLDDTRFWASRSTITDPARQLFHAHLLAEFEQCLDELPWTPDRIHAHFAIAERLPIAHAAQKRDIPMSVVPHAFGLFADPDYDALDDLFGTVDQIIPPTEYNKRYITEHYLPDAPISVVPAVSQLSGDSTVETVPNRILTVARFVEKKGYPYAIEAVAKVAEKFPEVEYHIVGDGNQEDDVRALIDEYNLGGTVTIRQQIPDDELAREFDEAAIFLLPCVIADDGNRDGLPVVLKEAMAMGTACVSTTVSGIPELIDDGENGLLVPPREPDATAKAISSLLEDPTYRDELAAAGKRHVTENLTPETAADKLEHAFETV